MGRNCRNSTVAKQEELLWVSGLLLGRSTMRLTPPRRRQTDCESWPCGLCGDSWRGATAVYIGIWMRTTRSGRTSVPRARTTLIGRAWRSQLGDSTGSQRLAFDLGVCSRDEGSGIVGVYRMYRSRSVVMLFCSAMTEHGPSGWASSPCGKTTLPERESRSEQATQKAYNIGWRAGDSTLSHWLESRGQTSNIAGVAFSCSTKERLEFPLYRKYGPAALQNFL